MERNRIEDNREKNKDKITIYKRIKSIKHLDIIIAVVVLVLALSIYAGFYFKPKIKTIEKTSDDDNFVEELEDVISSIDGVGNAKIIINYSNNSSLEIAHRTKTQTKVNADGSVSVIENTSEPVIIRNGKEDAPIILNSKENSILGVVVVAKGANNPKVKLSIIDAVGTLLDIEKDKVKVYEMKR